MATSQSIVQERWERRQKEMGKRRISVWVYDEDRQAVIKYAEKKRRARERAQ